MSVKSFTFRREKSVKTREKCEQSMAAQHGKSLDIVSRMPGARFACISSLIKVSKVVAFLGFFETFRTKARPRSPARGAGRNAYNVALGQVRDHELCCSSETDMTASVYRCFVYYYCLTFYHFLAAARSISIKPIDGSMEAAGETAFRVRHVCPPGSRRHERKHHRTRETGRAKEGRQNGET